MAPHEGDVSVWLNYFRAWLIVGLADVSAQTLMQRAFSAKDEQTAQNSFYLAGFGHLSLVTGNDPCDTGYYRECYHARIDRP